MRDEFVADPMVMALAQHRRYRKKHRKTLLKEIQNLSGEVKMANNSKDMHLLPNAEELATSLTIQMLQRELDGVHYHHRGELKMRFAPNSMATKSEEADGRGGRARLPSQACLDERTIEGAAAGDQAERGKNEEILGTLNDIVQNP